MVHVCRHAMGDSAYGGRLADQMLSRPTAQMRMCVCVFPDWRAGGSERGQYPQDWCHSTLHTAYRLREAFVRVQWPPRASQLTLYEWQVPAA